MYCVVQVCRALNVCILKMDKSNHLINDIGLKDIWADKVISPYI